MSYLEEQFPESEKFVWWPGKPTWYLVRRFVCLLFGHHWIDATVLWPKHCFSCGRAVGYPINPEDEMRTKFYVL